MPGKGTYVPKRYIDKIKTVNSMLKVKGLLIILINLEIDDWKKDLEDKKKVIINIIREKKIIYLVWKPELLRYYAINIYRKSDIEEEYLILLNTWGCKLNAKSLTNLYNLLILKVINFPKLL